MIKRVAIVSTIALLLLSGLGGITLTAAQQPAIRVMFNGQYMNLDVPPVIQGGRTLVPFRAIFEALGATVSWNDATRTATGTRGTTTVALTIGNNNATVNGVATRLDVAPIVQGGRTLVPLRFVSENLGATVQWVPRHNIVVVRGPAPAARFKIGVMTGTAVQNEEELRAAENMVRKYGRDRIVLTTYPARFTVEQETTISNLRALAADRDVRAIVIVQAVVGTAAGIEEVRRMRPDMLIIAGTPGEDMDLIARRADIILQTNDIARGRCIVEQAHRMGARTFVHYSFARHMANAMLFQRRQLMEQTANQLGMRFVFADAPDPTGEGGVTGTQQFIMEDIPRRVAQFGKDTAFFGTNCGMMEPMIRQVIATGAIFPVQCCPSPYHALPGALGISIPPDRQGDLNFVMSAIARELRRLGAEKRVSTWPVPVNMLYVEAGVEYAMAVLNNQTMGRVDLVTLEGILMARAGGPVHLTHLTTARGNYFHYFLFLSDYVDFSTIP